MMAALCSGALMGAGMVMFYMRGSSSGGLDFVIMPIKEKTPSSICRENYDDH